METGAADLVLVDERDAQPQLGGTEGGGVAAGAGADDDEVVGVGCRGSWSGCQRAWESASITMGITRPMVANGLMAGAWPP